MNIKRIICQLFTFTVASLIVGCGGSSDTKPINIVGETEIQPPLTSQKVSVLTADNIGDISMTDPSGNTVYALPSALFKEFAAGLIATPLAPAVKLNATQVSNAPVGLGLLDIISLADIIYGIVEDVAGKKEQETLFSDLGDQLKVINTKIDTLGKILESDINSSWSKLNLGDAKSRVFSANSRIESKYNGTDSGGFLYFTHQRSLIAACENIIATTGSSTTCTPEQQIAYANRGDVLKNQAIRFAEGVIKDHYLIDDVTTIHNVIVPSGDTRIFKALVTEILTENDPLPAPAKDKAMYAYLLLESMFSQFLSHQYQGASMIVNAENYDDKMNKAVNGSSANSYMTGTFESHLREECKEFLEQVNWLVVNLHDYRNKDIYAADMKFINQGLAPDPVFSDILARSRFYCAQVLQPYNENRQKGTNGTLAPSTAIHTNVVGNGFGLKGTIIAPRDYTNNEPITLNFYDADNKLAATTSSSPKVHNGRYPYTKWVPYTRTGYNMENLAAEAAYDWLVHDIDLSGSNLAAGTYVVRFEEKGKDPNGNTGPWVHADTLLGTVSLQYFDPKNPKAGKNTADPASSQLFGSFSLYWPWNFQRFTTSPVNFATDLQNVWSAIVPSKSFTLQPTLEYKGLVNQLTYSRHNFKSKSDGLSINIPFTVTAPMAEVAVVFNSTKNQVQGYFPASYPEGKYMKNYSVGYSYYIDSTNIATNKSIDKDNDKVADRLTIDSGKSKGVDPYVSSANSQYIPFTMSNKEFYNMNVGVELSSTYTSGWDVQVDSSIDADLNWYMQLLFTGKLSPLDIQ